MLLLCELLESRHFGVSTPDRVCLLHLVHHGRNGKLTLQVHETLLRQTVRQPEQDQILEFPWLQLQRLDATCETPAMERIPVIER